MRKRLIAAECKGPRASIVGARSWNIRETPSKSNRKVASDAASLLPLSPGSSIQMAPNLENMTKTRLSCGARVLWGSLVKATNDVRHRGDNRNPSMILVLSPRRDQYELSKLPFIRCSVRLPELAKLRPEVKQAAERVAQGLADTCLSASP